ncbi:SH3 domain-containing protein [Streptomyces sp. P38-E01]|uniref:SH3 domain-containing protein n=1 Tax=Streptomyces tardus TaxID=2780544 RepID=A0A949JCL6_9ACTN|nr:SH3 domain-containing protein [Streptomyces tardus]MBU7596982.1 SH3 domain-containing protein [Streptomyces tardus]
MALNTRRIRITAVALGVSALAGGTLLGAGAAQAAPGAAKAAAVKAAAAPALPYGTVVTPAGVNTRQYPSTDSSVKGVLVYGQQVGLDCKVNAQNVGGNTVWFKLRGAEQWVTARYVDNTGTVLLCKDKYPTAANGSRAANEAKG